MTGKNNQAGSNDYQPISSKIETAIIKAGNRLADIPQQNNDLPVDRRARLLAWTIIFLTMAMIPTGLIIFCARRYSGRVLILVLAIPVFYVLILSGSFHLNRKRLCRTAALLTVLGGAASVWVFLLLNQHHFGEVDLIALFYVTLSILLASFLLSTWQTFLLALAQIIGLILLLSQDNSWAQLDWQNLFAFLFSVSVLSFGISYITQTDLRQIERQNKLLLANEAILRDLATRDSLTRLYNLTYLQETLPREIHRVARHKSTVGVIALDVDFFKKTSDDHGHAAGDLLLQALANIVKSRIRDSDIACRYGGDQYILILPDASLTSVQERAETIRQYIARQTFVLADQEIKNVTVSCGVAVYPQHGTEPDALLLAADRALAQAKKAGRNRTSIAFPVAAADH